MFKLIKKLLGIAPTVLEEDLPIYKASMPRTKVIGYFIPLHNFEGYTDGGELLGHYKKGRTYYLREGNNLLAQLCEKWVEDKRITVIGV
jgi:hypothetical protein